ncbi:MAG: hypothetical protein FWE11_08845 [Defluviitaleaceae bacterium]|nr:hypothetical protein [Defluviitaleaceae bacterium]
MYYKNKERRNKFGKAVQKRTKFLAAFIFALIVTAAAVFAISGNTEDEYYDENLLTSITITRGQSIQDILPDTPQTTGYRFSHWSQEPDGAPFDFRQQLIEETTFYAIWVADNNTYDNRNQDFIGEAPYSLYGEDDEEQGHAYAPDYSFEESDYDYSHGYEHDEYDYGYSRGYYQDAYDYDYNHDEHSHDGYYGEHYYYDGYSAINAHELLDDYEVGEHEHTNQDYDYSYDGYDNDQDSYDYAHSYYHDEYNYDEDYSYYEYGYTHEPQHLDTNIYENFYAEDETIIIRFMWNHGGTWAGIPNIDDLTDININLDNRGNVSVYPNVEHSVILDGDYIHISLPRAFDIEDIAIILPLNWTYYIDYEVEEIEAFYEHNAYGEIVRAEATQRTNTIITVNHDILSRLDRSVGIVPFASGAPAGFEIRTLAYPFDNGAWLYAVGANSAGVNRVVVVPQDVEFLSVVALSGNRHVIIVSQGTNLNGTVDNHSAPGTVFTVTYTGTSGRHFTVANNTTLTLSHVILDGDVIIPSTSHLRGGITVAAGGHLNMLSGSVIRNSRINGGGGVLLNGTTGTFTMSGNASITGNSSGNSGGGVQVASTRSITMGGSASITNNVAATNGGGVALNANGGQLTINSGIISGNTANGAGAGQGGGGVFLASGANSRVYFNGGSIINNHSAGNGGGIFTTDFTYGALPSGTHFPQLHIAGAANFNGNTAGNGGFTPPANAVANTNIAITAQRSGGFAHALNNLDINFMPGDWLRLNSLILTTTQPNPGRIVIHPASASVTPGMAADGITYNFVISDPGSGSVITTLPLAGGATVHNITVSRHVTIEAAPGANISLRMPVPGSPNTPSIAPWETTRTTLERHFTIANGGLLTIGGGSGSGNITLDGNAGLLAQARGGVQVNAGGELALQAGGHVYNNRIATGGGVSLNGATAVFNMHGGSIANNLATTNGGGVALVTNGSRFNMYGGIISGNTTTGSGGGVHIATGALTRFYFNAGSIQNNHANVNAGGIFVTDFTYGTILPTGLHFPQLTVLSVANFGGNTAGNGGFAPPTNAVGNTNIAITAERSGNFDHALNNLDINFIPGDWARLNSLIISTIQPNPDQIIIHPTGSGVTPGMDGNTYHFIITDPGDGHTIATMGLTGGATVQNIAVARPVTIEAVSGVDIVIRMPIPNGANTPGQAPWATTRTTLERHFTINAGGILTLGGGAGSGNLILDGNADLLTQNRGGIGVAGAGAQLILQAGGVISNNRIATGGGVSLNNATAVFTMNGGRISNNIAGTNGGGVALVTNGSQFTMSGGVITGNTTVGNGGGVHVAVGVNTHFTFNGGSIEHNRASVDGGGVFAAEFTYGSSTLPPGMHYPNLTVTSSASFFGNISDIGGFSPPVNAVTNTAIAVTASRSGGFGHPLNNLDINFRGGDWTYLNALVSNAPLPNPDRIVIHPATSGVTPGMAADGITYNLVITDTANPNRITTTPIVGAPAADPHRINVIRSVTIEAAPGSNIVLAMTAPTAPNNSTSLGRHFFVGAAGELQLGGATSGNLTIDGFADTIAGTRGGITVNAGTGSLILANNSVVANNRIATGGGVSLTVAGAELTMLSGSSITNNIATTSGGGVALTANGTIFTMTGGNISGNTANGTGAAAGGGGVHLATGVDSHFSFEGGTIQNNHAVNSGGGIFTNNFLSAVYLPIGAYPQLTVSSAAAFINNTAGVGGNTPPGNAADATSIAVTSQVSGGFSHPLNNLDINFISIDADWFLLHSVVSGTIADNIVLHPRGSSVTPGLDGLTYNLVISDPGDGHTITTVHLAGGTTDQNIIVSRPVTIQAVAGADIVIRMPVPHGANTPGINPWLSTSTTLSRHFVVNAGGVLTLGGGSGSGTITLDGNAHLLTQSRGGVTVNANAELILQTGIVLWNNRAANGGGVLLAGNGANVTLAGGIIDRNFATTNGGGVHLATGDLSQFTFTSGIISNNHASGDGGGVFTSMPTYGYPLPPGTHYQQLSIESAAIFTGNTAGGGGFEPPANAVTGTDIAITNQRSGDFWHPLNNLDINFRGGDWIRLNNLVASQPLPTPDRIVIHPAGSAVTPGLGAGNIYNFIISPGNGNTITTLPILGAPAADPHRIEVLRDVIIEAAPGTNIVLAMTATTPANIGRHFTVGASGDLTLGGGTGTVTLNGNASTLTGNRGGVAINNASGILNLVQGSVITNSRAANGGGVAVSANGAQLIVTGGSITNNFATTNGGGVSLTVNGARFTMNNGFVTGNNATANGGGVHLLAGATSNFTFNGGSISNNQAGGDGGGVFAGTFTYGSPLPVGMHYPQLIIAEAAIFANNSAGNGGFAPPTNAVSNTVIAVTAQRSGGFAHPLNNLDINFLPGDWLRLNTLIGTAVLPNPQRIVIHPAGSSAQSGIDGTTYNFIISDPGDGSTITTVPITGAPAADPHRIDVQRAVIIEAAPGANIVFAMTTSAAPNGAENIGRHFIIGANGNLTLGGGSGSGNLTLDGNAATRNGNRGGITIGNATGSLTLAQGGTIYNSRAVNGGGVHLNANGALLTMNGGSIRNNIATSDGGGVHLIAGALSRMDFHSGTISDNHATWNGGGIFTAAFIYENPLPAGMHYPQLTVSSAAVFSGNTAGGGSSHPPSNAAANTNIAATQSSGGFTHPLNNLDINFFFSDADWFRLSRLINSTTVGHIVIHPSSAAGSVTPGIENGIYNFIITDPCPYGQGRTITTTHLLGGTTSMTININRSVIIEVANNANIVIRMPAPGAPNTPNMPPWISTEATQTRHFNVGTGGELTLGGIGSGTITIDGNANNVAGTGARGGFDTTGTGIVNLHSGTIITNNRASVGGGVHIGGQSVVNMFDGVIVTGNIADGSNGGGGGIATAHLATNATLNMFGGTIINNRAAHGAGMWTMSGIFNMYGGLITGNTAGVGVGSNEIGNHHGGGGGVMVCCSGHFTMHGGVIEGNIARTGGGVHMSHAASATPTVPATFTMRGGSIVNNHSTVTHLDPSYFDIPTFPNPGVLPFDSDGGGVFITESGLFVMADPTIISTPPININENIADRDGGGVYWAVGRWETDQRSELVTIAENTAIADGGGIYLAYGTLNLIGPWVIDENTANRGGGVFMRGNSMNLATLIFDNTTICCNTSMTDGGGVFMSQHTRLEMNGGRILSNRGNRGAAVSMIENTQFIMGGGQIYNHRYNSDDEPITQGGAIRAVSNTSIITLRGGTIGHNNIPQGNWAVNGGGIWVGEGARLNMEQGGTYPNLTHGTIRGNTATGSVEGHGGGGVFIRDEGTRFEMHAGEISHNQSINERNGGGVSLTLNAEFEMFNGNISHNQTIGSGPLAIGGGVSIHGTVQDGDGTFTMHGGVIHGNTANWSGGGINIQDASFLMIGGTISGNEALDGNGGGLHIAGDATGSVVVIEDGNIIGNKAFDSDDLGNGEGGGIHLWNSELTIEDATIQGNEAITGGGVSVVNSILNMYGGLIGGTGTNQGNEAKLGGGVFVGMIADFNLRGADDKSIVGNHAVLGGGIYVTEAGHMYMATGTNNLAITNNSALDMGGGIFTEIFEYTNPLTRTSGPDMAYRNLTLIASGTYFNHNTAFGWQPSPSNASAVLPGSWSSISGGSHPLNNYDINYIFPLILPMTGGPGFVDTHSGTMALAGIGAVLIAGAGVMVYVFNHKRKARKASPVMNRRTLD